ncbi:alpha/beta fold hydrolase [Marinicrinis sediminis]|uniref:Alpha/beta fold hydrolase n=1 Tax=Marinicrinis sediminis TaxID=1652465 RepID=A0ABW5R6W8_9BACL
MRHLGEHTIYKSVEGKQKLQYAYEQYLETFSLSFERKWVDTRFGPTHTLMTGPANGKPLIILQGGNCLNPMTLSWFEPLWSQYRIYAPDTIGHPGFSAETRISAKDDSFAKWIEDIMHAFQLQSSAFVGPSYGGGIILRLAAYAPEKIACAVLVSPAGVKLGSKLDMIRYILLPLIRYRSTSSPVSLQRIADVMSASSMSEQDKQIIGDIFQHVKLEQDMPKLTKRKELDSYKAPTMLLAGRDDIFFPGERLLSAASRIIPSLTISKSYESGHFPSSQVRTQMNTDIKEFLSIHY